jgi:hypothetical protein
MPAPYAKTNPILPGLPSRGGVVRIFPPHQRETNPILSSPPIAGSLCRNEPDSALERLSGRPCRGPVEGRNEPNVDFEPCSTSSAAVGSGHEYEPDPASTPGAPAPQQSRCRANTKPIPSPPLLASPATVIATSDNEANLASAGQVPSHLPSRAGNASRCSCTGPGVTAGSPGCRSSTAR